MAVTKNVYSFPFRKKDLIQAVSHTIAHFAHFRHAIDFLLPEGSKILAPRAGKVIDITVNSKVGGTDPKYAASKYQNYITIKHSDGEYSQYLHLKYKGALVKLGEKVRTGQAIALSGNTGLSSAPHLHFMVFKINKTKIGWESLKIRFKEKIHIDRTKRPIPKEQKKMADVLRRAREKLSKQPALPEEQQSLPEVLRSFLT